MDEENTGKKLNKLPPLSQPIDLAIYYPAKAERAKYDRQTNSTQNPEPEDYAKYAVTFLSLEFLGLVSCSYLLINKTTDFTIN